MAYKPSEGSDQSGHELTLHEECHDRQDFTDWLPAQDPDPKKRYLAAFAAGVFYVIIGLLGAAVVVFFASTPKELVLAIAGIALLATEREPALITFLVTTSGIVFGGIGAAFWG